MNTGTYPGIFKPAHITPLLKKPEADVKVFSNYMPTSNLNFQGKVFERIILDIFNKLLMTKKYYKINQSAHFYTDNTQLYAS